jgi:hypothetical protein
MSDDDKPTTAATKPYPLEALVLKAFEERAHHDGTSRGSFLAGAHVRGGSRAYRIVALDMLGYIKAQGKLTRDEYGWWRKTALASSSNGPNP